jgi:hypothetical protein
MNGVLRGRVITPRHKMTFRQDSMVWVWDSTWLPALVVQHAPMGSVLVRLDHGVTFNVVRANVLPRDPARRGSDIPQRVGHQTLIGRLQRELRKHEARGLQRGPIDGKVCLSFAPTAGELPK